MPLFKIFDIRNAVIVAELEKDFTFEPHKGPFDLTTLNSSNLNALENLLLRYDGVYKKCLVSVLKKITPESDQKLKSSMILFIWEKCEAFSNELNEVNFWQNNKVFLKNNQEDLRKLEDLEQLWGGGNSRFAHYTTETLLQAGLLLEKIAQAIEASAKETIENQEKNILQEVGDGIQNLGRSLLEKMNHATGGGVPILANKEFSPKEKFHENYRSYLAKNYEIIQREAQAIAREMQERLKLINYEQSNLYFSVDRRIFLVKEKLFSLKGISMVSDLSKLRIKHPQNIPCVQELFNFYCKFILDYGDEDTTKAFHKNKWFALTNVNGIPCQVISTKQGRFIFSIKPPGTSLESWVNTLIKHTCIYKGPDFYQLTNYNFSRQRLTSMFGDEKELDEERNFFIAKDSSLDEMNKIILQINNFLKNEFLNISAVQIEDDTVYEFINGWRNTILNEWNRMLSYMIFLLQLFTKELHKKEKDGNYNLYCFDDKTLGCLIQSSHFFDVLQNTPDNTKKFLTEKKSTDEHENKENAKELVKKSTLNTQFHTRKEKLDDYLSEVEAIFLRYLLDCISKKLTDKTALVLDYLTTIYSILEKDTRAVPYRIIADILTESNQNKSYALEEIKNACAIIWSFDAEKSCNSLGQYLINTIKSRHDERFNLLAIFSKNTEKNWLQINEGTISAQKQILITFFTQKEGTISINEAIDSLDKLQNFYEDKKTNEFLSLILKEYLSKYDGKDRNYFDFFKKLNDGSAKDTYFSKRANYVLTEKKHAMLGNEINSFFYLFRQDEELNNLFVKYLHGSLTDLSLNALLDIANKYLDEKNQLNFLEKIESTILELLLPILSEIGDYYFLGEKIDKVLNEYKAFPRTTKIKNQLAEILKEKSKESWNPGVASFIERFFPSNKFAYRRKWLFFTLNAKELSEDEIYFYEGVPFLGELDSYDSLKKFYGNQLEEILKMLHERLFEVGNNQQIVEEYIQLFSTEYNGTSSTVFFELHCNARQFISINRTLRNLLKSHSFTELNTQLCDWANEHFYPNILLVIREWLKTWVFNPELDNVVCEQIIVQFRDNLLEKSLKENNGEIVKSMRTLVENHKIIRNTKLQLMGNIVSNAEKWCLAFANKKEEIKNELEVIQYIIEHEGVDYFKKSLVSLTDELMSPKERECLALTLCFIDDASIYNEEQLVSLAELILECQLLSQDNSAVKHFLGADNDKLNQESMEHDYSEKTCENLLQVILGSTNNTVGCYLKRAETTSKNKGLSDLLNPLVVMHLEAPKKSIIFLFEAPTEKINSRMIGIFKEKTLYLFSLVNLPSDDSFYQNLTDLIELHTLDGIVLSVMNISSITKANQSVMCLELIRQLFLKDVISQLKMMPLQSFKQWENVSFLDIKPHLKKWLENFESTDQKKCAQQLRRLKKEHLNLLRHPTGRMRDDVIIKERFFQNNLTKEFSSLINFYLYDKHDKNASIKLFKKDKKFGNIYKEILTIISENEKPVLHSQSLQKSPHSDTWTKQLLEIFVPTDKEISEEMEVTCGRFSRGYINPEYKTDFSSMMKSSKIKQEFFLEKSKLCVSVNKHAQIGNIIAIGSFFRDIFELDFPFYEVLKFKNKEKNKKIALISNSNKGRNFDEDFHGKIDSTTFSYHFLMTLLLSPQHESIAHFLINESGQLFRLDNDTTYFMPSTYSQGEKTNLGVKSIIYCLDNMQQPLSQEVVQRILALDCYALIRNWLFSLKIQNSRMTTLFSESEFNEFAQDDKPQYIFPTFNENFAEIVYKRFASIQMVLQENRHISAHSLQKRLEPALAKFYEFEEEERLFERFRKIMAEEKSSLPKKSHDLNNSVFRPIFFDNSMRILKQLEETHINVKAAFSALHAFKNALENSSSAKDILDPKSAFITHYHLFQTLYNQLYEEKKETNSTEQLQNSLEFLAALTGSMLLVGTSVVSLPTGIFTPIGVFTGITSMMTTQYAYEKIKKLTETPESIEKNMLISFETALDIAYKLSNDIDSEKSGYFKLWLHNFFFNKEKGEGSFEYYRSKIKNGREKLDFPVIKSIQSMFSQEESMLNNLVAEIDNMGSFLGKTKNEKIRKKLLSSLENNLYSFNTNIAQYQADWYFKEHMGEIKEVKEKIDELVETGAPNLSNIRDDLDTTLVQADISQQKGNIIADAVQSTVNLRDQITRKTFLEQLSDVLSNTWDGFKEGATGLVTTMYNGVVSAYQERLESCNEKYGKWFGWLIALTDLVVTPIKTVVQGVLHPIDTANSIIEWFKNTGIYKLIANWQQYKGEISNLFNKENIFYSLGYITGSSIPLGAILLTAPLIGWFTLPVLATVGTFQLVTAASATSNLLIKQYEKKQDMIKYKDQQEEKSQRKEQLIIKEIIKAEEKPTIVDNPAKKELEEILPVIKEVGKEERKARVDILIHVDHLDKEIDAGKKKINDGHNRYDQQKANTNELTNKRFSLTHERIMQGLKTDDLLFSPQNSNAFFSVNQEKIETVRIIDLHSKRSRYFLPNLVLAQQKNIWAELEALNRVLNKSDFNIQEDFFYVLNDVLIKNKTNDDQYADEVSLIKKADSLFKSDLSATKDGQLTQFLETIKQTPREKIPKPVVENLLKVYCKLKNVNLTVLNEGCKYFELKELSPHHVLIMIPEQQEDEITYCYNLQLINTTSFSREKAQFHFDSSTFFSAKSENFSGSSPHIEKENTVGLDDDLEWPGDTNWLWGYNIQVVAEKLIKDKKQTGNIRFAISVLSDDILDTNNRKIGGSLATLENVISDWEKDKFSEPVLVVSLDTGGHWVYVMCIRNNQNQIHSLILDSLNSNLNEISTKVKKALNEQNSITSVGLNVQQDTYSCGNWVLKLLNNTLLNIQNIQSETLKELICDNINNIDIKEERAMHKKIFNSCVNGPKTKDDADINFNDRVSLEL